MQRNRTEQGQATVEVALVFPLFIIICLGVIQIGVVGRRNIELTHAARAGAREAVVNPDGASVRSAVLSATNLEAGRISVSLSGGSSPGEHLTVTVSYEDPTDVPLVGRFIGPMIMSEELSVRVE